MIRTRSVCRAFNEAHFFCVPYMFADMAFFVEFLTGSCYLKLQKTYCDVGVRCCPIACVNTKFE